MSSSKAKTTSTPPQVPPPPAATAVVALPETYEMVKLPLKQALDTLSGKTAVVAATGTVKTVDELVGMMPETIVSMGSKGRGMILGVSPVLVIKEFLIHVVAARMQGNPAPLVYCGVLAVALAYTVSRDWVEEYADIPSPHMFTAFEIDGRTMVKQTETSAAVEWVANSKMNAAALRVFGSMIVEAGQGSSFLKHVKETAGTIFNPLEGTKERDLIMKEASKSISATDRIALEKFVGAFGKYAQVVGALFGGGDVEFISYLEVAQQIGELTI